MILGILALLVLGFFFPPLWLVLIGYLIYIYASRHTRKERAVEGRIRAMIAAKKDMATFSELYYEAARSYAVSKGCTVLDHEAASAAVMIDGEAYNAVFLREQNGGTTITLQDHGLVQKKFNSDLERVLAVARMQEAEPSYLENVAADILAERALVKGHEPSFLELLKRAEAGNADAQNHVGRCYLRGVCEPSDYKKAHLWLVRAAEQGSAQAQFNLGCLYYRGLGRKRDPAPAAKWFNQAMENGHPQARQELQKLADENPIIFERHERSLAKGIEKAPGLLDYELAHLYLEELMDITHDSEVRAGFITATQTGQLPLSKMTEVQEALMWMWNLSSATDFSYQEIIAQVAEYDWSMFAGMPRAGSGEWRK
ncbi:tetratricopeptide repeat protein [Stenotrophomonas muris]|uniref:tetratricopeptide repeat protein n=1 Tax=Stenotrophomonas muris TaxID=2963283 RepID=UPI00300EFF15